MKKIISILIMITIVFSAANVFAKEKESNVFAKDDLKEYKTLQLTCKDNGGIGFATGFGSDAECTQNKFVNPNTGIAQDYFMLNSGGKGVVFARQDNKLYRRFTTPIDVNEESEYIVTFNIYVSSGSVPSTYDMRYYLGNKAYGGMIVKDNEDETKSFYASALGNAGKAKFTNQTEYTVAINFSINPEGKSKIRTQIVPKGTELSTKWDAESEILLPANETLDYMLITMSGWGAVTYYSDFLIEKYSKSEYDILINASGKMDEDLLSEEESISVVKILSAFQPAYFSDGILNKINNYAEVKKYNLYPAKIESSTIDDNNKYTAQDLESAEVIYSYYLTDATAELYENGEKTEISSEITENKMNVSFKLKPNSEYVLKLLNVKDFAGNKLPEKEIPFSTNKVPYINIKDGGTYGQYSYIKWEEYNGVAITAEISDENGEKTIENGYQLTEGGRYKVSLKIKGEDGEETAEYNINVEDAYAPEASDVGITGKAATGETIKGSYIYSDKNGDAEKDSIYKWYRSASENGKFKEIEGALGLEYVLTEEDENSYLKFGVKPIAESFALSEGEEVLSPAFVGAFAPQAEDVKIIGRMKKGETLKAEYRYSDKNNDEEGESTITWYSVSDSEKTKIAEGKEIIIDDSFSDKVIALGVTPVAKNSPFEGKEAVSENVKGIVKPYADNVYIGGKAVSGNTLTGYYTYHDDNNDEEGNTETGWFEGDTRISDGKTLKLSKSHAGKSIRFGVKPVSINEPFSGEWIYSDAVTVQSSGGTGGSGGVGGAGYIVPGFSTETQKTETDKIPNDGVQSEKLTDIEGHWAKEYISELYEKGIVNGVGNREFQPERKVTRAEFLAMLFRVKEFSKEGYINEFSDVDSSSWYYDYIAMGINSGAIAKAENFRPNDEITRQECAKIISVLCNLKGMGDLPDFKDVKSISVWAREYVLAVYDAGIMTGNTDFFFKPLDGLKRGECAKIIWYIMKG